MGIPLSDAPRIIPTTCRGGPVGGFSAYRVIFLAMNLTDEELKNYCDKASSAIGHPVVLLWMMIVMCLSYMFQGQELYLRSAMSQISWQMDVHPANFWNKHRFWFIPILKISLNCPVVWLRQSDGGVLSVSTPRRTGGNHLQLGGSDRGSSGSAFCESYAAEWCNLFGVRCGFWCLDSAVCSPFRCFWEKHSSPISARILPQAGKRFGGLVVGFHGGRDSFFFFLSPWNEHRCSWNYIQR